MKKLVSLLLALMMLLSLAAVASADEPVEIVVACKTLGNGWPTDLKDDFIYQQILKATGVSWRLVLVDDYYTALGARISGGDMPDLVEATSTYMRDWARQDLLLDLTPYTENELSGLMTWLGKTTLIPYQVDGKLFALPRMHDGSTSQWAISIRKDWLEKLELEVPKTIEDLYNVAYAFTYNDPDGNGQNDTLGLSGAKGMAAYQTIAGPYDTAFGNYIIIRDGKVTNTLLQPGMPQALEMAKKFVDNGLMDPDCYTVSGTDRAKQGQVGMLMITWPGMYKAYGRQQIAEVNPNAEWIAFGPLDSAVGGEACLYPVDHNTASVAWSLNADLADEPEKLEAIFKVLNYFISDEGSDLIFYGIEGEHWTRNADGQITMTENATAANYISTYQIFSRIEREYLAVKFPEAVTEFNHSMSMKNVEIYNSLVTEPEDMYLSDMTNYVTEQLINFISGYRPITEYDAFLQELRDTYMFDEYMQAATEQLVGYGLATE